jgi:hypothetical protein
MRCVLLDRELSALNHRLYRQSRVYCGSVRIRTPVSSGRNIKVYTLAHSWMLAKAAQKAEYIYMRAMETEFSLIRKPRWHDFRIAPFDTGDDMTGIDASRLALSNWERNGDGYGPAQVDDYAYSRLHVENDANTGTEAIQFHAIGPTRFTNISGAGFASYGILEEYNAMDDTDQDTVAAEGGTYGSYQKLVTDGDSDATDNNLQELATDGDLPPYDRDGIDAVRALTLVGTIDGQGETNVLNFEAPLGMLFLQASHDDVDCIVNMKKGSYKGVHAPPLYERVRVLSHNMKGGHNVL